MYVDVLLERIRDLFSAQYSPKKFSYPAFEGPFKRELEKAEQRTESRLKPSQHLANGNLTNRKVTASMPSCLLFTTNCPHKTQILWDINISGLRCSRGLYLAEWKRWVISGHDLVC